MIQRGEFSMSMDYEAIKAMGALINELKSALGEKALELPSVRKAMLVLDRNAWDATKKFHKEAKSRDIQDDLWL
jgi:hypothetical protein